jgi:phosphoglycerate kinase
MKASIADLPNEFYKGKRTLVRVDYNVPLRGGQVNDDFRIRSSTSTLNYLSTRGARLIVASHLGRPAGKPDPTMSLKPVAEYLQKLLPNRKIRWISECIGKDVENSIKNLTDGDILVLENLRFHLEEEKNDDGFSRSLASLAEVFVNDAFSVSHRKHASTYGVPSLLQYRLAGLQLQKELEYLTKIRDEPTQPFTLVIGGAKIHDKIDALKRLIGKANKVLIGGCIAYTFLASRGMSIGESPIENDFVPWASEILSREDKILLPEDHLVAPNIDSAHQFRYARGDIPLDMMGFDIGPLTSGTYTSVISSTHGTVFWNGPMGLFELEEFSHGTADVALAIALARFRGATTVVGGGDSVSALGKAGVTESEVSHISTGGGASLEYIGGKILPGIEILNDV